MLHLVIPVGPLQCNCSIIADESTREAIVVDPGDEVNKILALVARHQLSVRQIVITHAHIDHVYGAAKLKAATGAPVLMNASDHALLLMLDMQANWIGLAPPDKVTIDAPLEDDAKVTVGGIEGKVIHTPGHTEGSVCLYLPAEQKLIAGDTLFAGSIGRTDLPGGSYDKIIESLHSRVLALPDETVVIPGHGPQTTIGAERTSNPFLI